MMTIDSFDLVLAVSRLAGFVERFLIHVGGIDFEAVPGRWVLTERFGHMHGWVGHEYGLGD